MNIKAAYMVPHPPLIIPEVGKGEERVIAATITAYQQVAKEIKEIHPDTVVILSPHSIMYADYFHISPGTNASGSFASFRAPKVTFEVQYDQEFTDLLSFESEQSGIAAGCLGERDPNLDHGTMVPLYFLKQAYEEMLPKIVRIGLSGFSFEEHYRFGRMIQKTASKLNRNVVLMASGDLSHRLKSDGPYGYKKEGPEYDEALMEYASKADFRNLLLMKEDFCDLAGECGQRSFCIMAGALDGIDVVPTKLSYEGPYGVGYGIVSFHPIGWSENRKFLQSLQREKKKRIDEKRANEDAYVRLARQSLEEYVSTRRKIKLPDAIPDDLLHRRAGCFVSLKKDGKLRGCIGTIAATQTTLAEEIMENARSAATRDPRFDPVSKEELDTLEISVDVLGEAEDISSPKELDVKRYGVIVSKGFQRGLLLPNLDGVDTVKDQIQIAMEKAGIPTGEKVKLQRFEVVRHY